MARIRSVHPGLFTDEDFVTLTPDAKIFFIGLWCEADDGGVFEWKPLTLKMKLMAWSTDAAEPLLDELEAADRIRRYRVDGRSYGVVRNFAKWQRPQKPRAVHPLPSELRAFAGLEKARAPNPSTARQAPQPEQRPPQPELPIDYDTSTRNRNQREEVGGRRDEVGGKRKVESENTHTEPRTARGDQAEPAAAPLRGAGVCVERGFREVWDIWLNRDGVRQAELAYATACRKADPAVILAAAGSYVGKIADKYPGADDRERFAGKLANWLRDERWRDWSAAEQRHPVDIDPPQMIDWQTQMLVWTDPKYGGPTRENWDAAIWGPMPGDAGCRVPKHLASTTYYHEVMGHPAPAPTDG